MTRFWRSATARFLLLIFGIELILAAGMALALRAITRAELESDPHLSHIVDRATGLALLLAVPLALFAAYAAVRIVKARVDDIVETAEAVRAGRLSRRVPLDGSADTFDRLGLTLNAMLDQTEALICELRIVTDGLAHDLRSPLTRLKVRLDHALHPPDAAGQRAALIAAEAEADLLLAMLSTALQISRAEAGIGRDHFTPVDLGQLLHDLADLYQPLAEENGLRLRVETGKGPVLPAHRELLSQAVSNLIDNAFKYGAGPIRLAAGLTDKGGWIRVCDAGPGIAPADHAEALRRFGRLDPARSGLGAGLGLALVGAVARLHNGSIRLEDAGPGLCVELRLGPA